MTAVEGWVLRPPAHDDWAPDPAPALVAYAPDGGEAYLCARSGNLTVFNTSSAAGVERRRPAPRWATIEPMTALGAPASNFVCNSTGTSGVCQGTTAATQQAFIALQTEVNRVGRSFGVTKIATDGKIGPKTMSALAMLADRLSAKLRGQLDPSLDVFLIEAEAGVAPTTPRDVALNAETITAALKRDGAIDAPWSVMTAAQSAIHQAVDNVVSAVSQPTPAAQASQAAPLWTGAGAPPWQGPWTDADGRVHNGWYAPTGAPINPYPGASTAPVQPAPRMPLGLKIGLGVTAAAIVGGVIAAIARPRRGVAGVSCACQR